MRNFLAALFLFPLIAFAQCAPVNIGNSFYTQPSFVTLYNSGQCLTGDFTSGSIFVKYDRIENTTQTPRFSFASDEGYSATLVQINQYDLNCNQIAENLNSIWQGTGSVIIEYVIQSDGFQVLCPYARTTGVLSVKWGIVNANWFNDVLRVKFNTYSNTNTLAYHIEVSQDLEGWENLIDINPVNTNSSTESEYNRNLAFNKVGTWYLRIVEVEINGSETYSDILPFIANVRMEKRFNYDLSGRLLSVD